MRILTNALNKILAGCCCIILAVHGCLRILAGGGALLYSTRQAARSDEFTQILFIVDDSV
ncbi:hypothetical protein LFZ31_04810 [Salmonella enterica subsp. enterica serovar Newport str. S09097]|nr:hypothetical protein LFZ31_04810 [Salmonella enterica subsp. enterica serovar Newport str. S09097]